MVNGDARRLQKAPSERGRKVRKGKERKGEMINKVDILSITIIVRVM